MEKKKENMKLVNFRSGKKEWSAFKIACQMSFLVPSHELRALIRKRTRTLIKELKNNES